MSGKAKPTRTEELAAWKLKATRDTIRHELDKGKLDAAARVLVGHAMDRAFALPEVESAQPCQYDYRRTLGNARKVERAWAAAVREIIATLVEMSPNPAPSPAAKEAAR